MNYLKIYNDIIDKGINRDWKSIRYGIGSILSNCYTETHHIVPKYKEKYKIRMSGGNNPGARKVINYKTGEIFDTIKQAADHIGMNISTFKKYLYNKQFDKLDFLYYYIIDEEVENGKK